MELKVGTFNLNNLFSRFNFSAHVDELPADKRDVTVTYEFDEEGDYWKHEGSIVELHYQLHIVPAGSQIGASHVASITTTLIPDLTLAVTSHGNTKMLLIDSKGPRLA